MQTTIGKLVIIDPHLAPKVFWNGLEVPVLKIRMKAKIVTLVVSETTIIPEDLEATPGVEIKRRDI